jgi:hypothetical protein
VLALLALGLATADPEELRFDEWKRSFRRAMLRDPLDSLAAVVLGGSYLFLLAERGANPKCVTFMDALVFITTCLSVGYDDCFAQTEAGKGIASFVMTFGPALSGAALEPPAGEHGAGEHGEQLAVSRAMLARLDQILAALDRPDPR